MVVHSRWLVLLSLAMLACSSGTVNMADVPPRGSIWFGDSFDPATFELTSKRTEARVGMRVVMVAALKKDLADKAPFSIEVKRDGTTVFTSPGTVANGPWSVAGFAVTDYLTEAGAYDFRVFDVGANEVSAGSIRINPRL